MTDQSAPSYAPFRLNLEQQKKRAKELCQALKAADPRRSRAIAASIRKPAS